MPAIPPKWRRWLYATGIAFVPLATAFGWVNDDKAAAIAGVLYAVFMGGLATANVPKGGDD